VLFVQGYILKRVASPFILTPQGVAAGHFTELSFPSCDQAASQEIVYELFPFAVVFFDSLTVVFFEASLFLQSQPLKRKINRLKCKGGEIEVQSRQD
jgi:hypothetical protein